MGIDARLRERCAVEVMTIPFGNGDRVVSFADIGIGTETDVGVRASNIAIRCQVFYIYQTATMEISHYTGIGISSTQTGVMRLWIFHPCSEGNIGNSIPNKGSIQRNVNPTQLMIQSIVINTLKIRYRQP